jgi:hypothetical protein
VKAPFLEGEDVRVLHSNVQNPLGGRPVETFLLRVACTEHVMARKVGPSESRAWTRSAPHEKGVPTRNTPGGPARRNDRRRDDHRAWDRPRSRRAPSISNVLPDVSARSFEDDVELIGS